MAGGIRLVQSSCPSWLSCSVLTPENWDTKEWTKELECSSRSALLSMVCRVLSDVCWPQILLRKCKIVFSMLICFLAGLPHTVTRCQNSWLGEVSNQVWIPSRSPFEGSFWCIWLFSFDITLRQWDWLLRRTSKSSWIWKSSLLTNLGHKIRTEWLLRTRIWAGILGLSHPAVYPEGIKTSYSIYMVFSAS